MRIIAGTAGGVPIKVPKETTRPTTDRVLEAVFSMLGDRVADEQVLDLFAGSGALGMEALSRGAAAATFVDESRQACKVIDENLAKTKLTEHATVLPMRVERYLFRSSRQTFGLVFADPPYARDEERAETLNTFLQSGSIVSALAEDGLLVLESYSRVSLPIIDGLRPVQEKIYGDTRVTFFAHS